MALLNPPFTSKILITSKKPKTLIKETLEELFEIKISSPRWKELTSRGAFKVFYEGAHFTLCGRISYSSRTLTLFEGWRQFSSGDKILEYVSVEVLPPAVNGETVVWIYKSLTEDFSKQTHLKN